MQVIKVYRGDSGEGFVAYKDKEGLLEEVNDFREGDEVGDELRLVKAEMTKKEYNSLPEFKGW